MRDSPSEATSEAVERLLSGDFTGPPVLGLPTSWNESAYEQDDLFHLYVGVLATSPRQVWEVVVEWPADSPYSGTGFRLRCVSPDKTSRDWVYGWIGIDVIGVVVCDHSTRPHRARVLAMEGHQLAAMPELAAVLDGSALDEDDERVLDVEVVPAYFSSTLAPLAVAIIEDYREAGAEEPIRVPPFSLLPPGPEWEPEAWDPADLPMPPITAMAVSGLPVMHQEAEVVLHEWHTYDVAVTDIVEDHGWFTTVGRNDRPGGDWGSFGWAAWPDGTLLAVSRSDVDDNAPPLVNRIALSKSDHPEPERREWWLALMRGLPLASSWLPKYW